ncbi:glycosyl hydrolase [Pontiellaceae bacterium B12227]|nr:glycosyl hydrolase [Pontiellaceae bacterium B12227]
MTLKQQFRTPGIEWRGKPFWSWNGKLEKNELLQQIDVLKEMGMGGFFMHSRTGLETEYLGEEWFELINTCADYAESIGLEAWLYDEDRWPSGLAGGIVSRHPEFRQKAILMEIDPEEPRENTVAEFSCELDGTVCTQLGTGTSLLRFSIIEQGTSGFYNGYTYIDTMNRDATEAFLASTHEKYAAHCGDRLGKSIKGIFTDEPHRGALLDGFSMYMENGEQTAPYTPALFDEFQNRFGYDLKEKLPELFLQVDGRRISQVKWHYVELLQQLFIENFAVPCNAWCTEHNLILTGHVLHEDNLTAQTAMSGSVMRYYEHMAAPGVDVLSEGNRNYWIVKQLSSAARQTGKTQLLSELYGCTGWQMDFAGHKAVGDWQALLGINLRCHHLSWYTMRGEAKRDYPASILHQSAWHKEYQHVEDYFARFGLMMAQGEPVCDLLVINPVESVWAQVYTGWSKGLNLQDKHIQTLEKSYQTLFTWLLESQIDFDYGDEEMLSRLGHVENGILKVGCAAYNTVLVSGMETIRASTLALLKRFSEAGGRVVFAGSPPAFIDAEENDSAILFAENSTFIPFKKKEILNVVPEPQATVDAPDIFGLLRKTDDGLIFAALNVDRDERRETAAVRIKTDLPIAEWNCETGRQTSVETSYSKGWQTFNTDFPKGGNKLYIASRNFQALEKSEGDSFKKFHPLEDSGPLDYTLSEPNLCVLDFAEYKIDGDDWKPEADVLKIDRLIREEHGILRRGGEMLQPWFTAQHAVKQLCDVELRYTFEIDTVPDQIDLVIEEPENFTVEFNGRPLDLNVSEPWIDIAFHRIRLPQDLPIIGKNEITLKTRYKENSNLEAVYLLGDFGVQLDGTVRKIIPKVGKIRIGDLCTQGFPFYSGAITYRIPLPAGAKTIRLPDFGGAYAKVGGKVLGWDPYEAEVSGESVDVEIVLTRRNTFGPLHDAVPDRIHNGPDHWLTEGPEFSRNPVLIPSGLLAPPLFSTE